MSASKSVAIYRHDEVPVVFPQCLAPLEQVAFIFLRGVVSLGGKNFCFLRGASLRRDTCNLTLPETKVTEGNAL